MTAAVDDRARPRPARKLLFTATIFAGSFLLFLIQPMIARMALPRVGGAPAVWNSAMLVYQALLLGGYAYAHGLTRLGTRAQSAVHLVALLLAAALLPIGLSAHGPPPHASPFLWVPWLLFTSIGPLFFLISANAPLLQRWFASSSGADPFALYAASNLGSFAGLIAYPLLLEPLLPVSQQRLLWSGGYAVLVVLLAGCALLVWRSNLPPQEQAQAEPSRPLPRMLVGKWVWLAFVPSGLMLSSTLFITTDLSPMPLLWVVPLGLYLLSFTVAFAARGGFSRIVALIAPYLLVPAAIAVFMGDRLPLTIVTGFVLVALFSIATALHRKLYELRPDPRQLTGFYLAVAVGGALGGLFCALVAPLIFDWTYEYPLLLIGAAVTLLPGYSPLVPRGWFERPAAAALIVGGSALVLIGGGLIALWPRNTELVRYGSVAAIAIGSLTVGSRAVLIATMMAAMAIAGGWEKVQLSATSGRLIRTYFGTYSVTHAEASRQLLHGTTLHGIQLLTPGWERWQTTYYARESGVGQALQSAPPLFGPTPAISVVGLGTGTLACYKRPGQRWTFYEIDPAMVALATTSGQFSFMSRCAPDARIVLGDARLALAKAPPASADILIVDAFSSDAVPMHLLTREAFAVYARHLKHRGLLLVHISNRHLDLEGVVAAAPGWQARLGNYTPDWDHRQLTASDWMALSRSQATISALARAPGGWIWAESRKPRVRWTDDHASLLSVFN
ncbi:MAG: Bll6585 protein [uncultured Sphingomonas sp.]|uniref:Bll6585 protein n=1 Tax=uncultured Sphingomonas sp. TaxID=158754 RepID=A0A6J4SLA5_9SPHN|nr:MAG: Bll6585 protein [uncultured Sphingomonas sp.]